MPDLKKMSPKELQEYMDEPVTFIFRNLEHPGQQHQYIAIDKLVILKHGVKYTLPRKYIESLSTLYPDFKVEGDVDQEKIITRSDRPRFFVEIAEPDPPSEEEQKKKDEVIAQIVAKKSKIKSDEVVTE
jgi:hypothetical protein